MPGARVSILFIQFPSHLPLGWKDVGVSCFLFLFFCLFFNDFCLVYLLIYFSFFFFLVGVKNIRVGFVCRTGGCRNLSDSAIFFDTVKLRVHREPASVLAAMAVLTGLAFHFELPRPLPPLPAPAPTHTHTHAP